MGNHWRARHVAEGARLRPRFAGIWHSSLVDHDFDLVTSDRRMHRGMRTFFPVEKQRLAVALERLRAKGGGGR